jgi:hypothetical protein
MSFLLKKLFLPCLCIFAGFSTGFVLDDSRNLFKKKKEYKHYVCTLKNSYKKFRYKSKKSFKSEDKIQLYKESIYDCRWEKYP